MKDGEGRGSEDVAHKRLRKFVHVADVAGGPRPDWPPEKGAGRANHASKTCLFHEFLEHDVRVEPWPGVGRPTSNVSRLT